MAECIALLRGINVGRAKRVAMADLRELFEGLGHARVRTLLNSGNVLFQSARPNAAKLASTIEGAVVDSFGFSARVIVITSAELQEIVKSNPLLSLATDPTKLLVAFVRSTTTLAAARPLLAERWAPDALAIGRRAAYLWCAKGLLASKLVPAFSRATGEDATMRNWATVLKLQAAADTGDENA